MKKRVGVMAALTCAVFVLCSCSSGNNEDNEPITMSMPDSFSVHVSYEHDNRGTELEYADVDFQSGEASAAYSIKGYGKAAEIAFVDGGCYKRYDDSWYRESDADCAALFDFSRFNLVEKSGGKAAFYDDSPVGGLVKSLYSMLGGEYQYGDTVSSEVSLDGTGRPESVVVTFSGVGERVVYSYSYDESGLSEGFKESVIGSEVYTRPEEGAGTEDGGDLVQQDKPDFGENWYDLTSVAATMYDKPGGISASDIEEWAGVTDSEALERAVGFVSTLSEEELEETLSEYETMPRTTQKALFLISYLPLEGYCEKMESLLTPVEVEKLVGELFYIGQVPTEEQETVETEPAEESSQEEQGGTEESAEGGEIDTMLPTVPVQVKKVSLSMQYYEHEFIVEDLYNLGVPEDSSQEYLDALIMYFNGYTEDELCNEAPFIMERLGIDDYRKALVFIAGLGYDKYNMEFLEANCDKDCLEYVIRSME